MLKFPLRAAHEGVIQLFFGLCYTVAPQVPGQEVLISAVRGVDRAKTAIDYIFESVLGDPRSKFVVDYSLESVSGDPRSKFAVDRQHLMTGIWQSISWNPQLATRVLKSTSDHLN